MADRDPSAPPAPDSASAERMRERWDRLAREDAMFYVAPRHGPDATARDFYASGGELAQQALAWAGQIERGRLLEIGCGPGRILSHLAPHFDRLDGVEIAPEMIEVARQQDLPENVHLELTPGDGELNTIPSESIDLVCSFHVFQHIPHPSVVARYVSETARVLKPSGRAVLHFDTHARSLPRRLALKLPDRLLPRTHRRFIRRYPLPAGWPAEAAIESGLEVLDERGRGGLRHLLLLAPRPAS
jgi:SAM-dependent methyltransferase